MSFFRPGPRIFPASGINPALIEKQQRQSRQRLCGTLTCLAALVLGCILTGTLCFHICAYSFTRSLIHSYVHLFIRPDVHSFTPSIGILCIFVFHFLSWTHDSICQFSQSYQFRLHSPSIPFHLSDPTNSPSIHQFDKSRHS